MQRRLVLVGILVCLLSPAGAEDAVQFSDPQLKRAVEDALQIFDPTPADMLWLTSLKASGRKISDLTGLEYAKNLQNLRVTHNQISDLSPLSSLKNLWKLVPNNNHISDLSPLSSLTQLKHLDIHENRISDLSHLASLTNLEYLNIHDNEIYDLSPIASLANLRFLNLHHNDIASIDDLSQMTQVTSLLLGKNYIDDISGLSNMTNLETLALSINRIEGIESLSALTQLQDLSLYSNRISDVGPLAMLSNLQYLDLYSNNVSDITALLGLENLRALDLERNDRLTNEAYADHIPRIYENNRNVTIYYSPNANPPTRVVASQGTSDDKVRLTWEAPPNGPAYTSFYQVSKSISIEGIRSPIMEWLTALSFDDMDIERNTRYYYWIQVAVSQQGSESGPYSEPTLGYTTQVENRIFFVDNVNSDPDIQDGTVEHPFDQIQKAIDIAPANATIMVREGIYQESISLLGKNISLIGDDPSNNRFPVIQGHEGRPLVSFVNDEEPSCLLAGFVLTRDTNEPSNAIYCQSSSPTIINCLIIGNHTLGTTSEASTIVCHDSNAVFINCTIADNTTNGDAAALLIDTSDILLMNSIVWNNSPGTLLVSGNSKPTMSYNSIDGRWPELLIKEDMGNIVEDPLFVQHGYWIDQNPLHPTWVPGDYHLMSEAGHWDDQSQTWKTDNLSSPCIDRANPETVLGKEPVPHGDIVNMGAYGGTSQASLSLTN